ncbi:MAG TPA: CoA transferase [Nitrososphaera sp.]|nr:CoA transferase [Nitrososphaera sp.]
MSNGSTDKPLTKVLRSKLNNLVSSPEFDLYAGLNEVLSGIGLTANDAGGNLTFYGQDPIVPSCLRFGTMSAIGLAAKAVAAAGIWKFRSGQGQDIHVDVRKALRRFAPFFEREWERVNGHQASFASDPENPYIKYPPMTLWNQTRDGRWVMPANIYPRLRARATTLLRCSDSVSSLQNAMLQWRADELETAAAEAGLPFAMLRTTQEFMKELQYTEVLSREPLIRLEKIGESDPVPFKPGAKTPLDGVRALGMGHVIAGAGIGRDLALFGADVLNIWQPLDWELDIFYYTSHVGMRSSILDLHEKADLGTFNQLLKDADVFFSNRRPGYLERYNLTADELCSKRPGLIHAKVVLYGETGPWSNRTGFDEVAGAVTGLFALEGTPDNPRLPPIHVVCDYMVGWFASVGIMAALRRRAVEGGSYRVVVSLAGVTLWLLSLGIFDKKYAQATAGSSDEHTYVAPDLFTADTPLGRYQGVTEQVVMSRTPGSFRTVLVPRGSSKPEWES